MELSGNEVVSKIKKELRNTEPSPKLSVIFVGDSEASRSFIKKKKEMCKELGFRFSVEKFPSEASEKEVLEKIRDLNRDPEVHGILPQLPLPGISEEKVFREIRPEKDVDGLTPFNLGLLLRGETDIMPGTVSAILELFNYYNVEVERKDVVIVNNSNLIGKPLSMALTNRRATVTLCHQQTRSLKKHTKNADILVTATGHPNLITESMVQKNAIVIDAGYAKENGKIQGDVKFDEVREKASKITPNPGGVGPITVAATMRNLLKCYKLQQDEK